MSEAVATKTKLYRQSDQDISLKDALNKVKELMPGAIALLYSPQACRFGKLESDGQVTICCNSKQDWQEQHLDLSPESKAKVFEARVFNEQAELRWLSIPGRKGKAVLIAETDLGNGFADHREPLTYLETLDQTYVLWGKRLAQRTPEQWSILSAARIGSMSVPISAGTSSQDTVILHSREYLGEVDKYGNVAVQEERLVKLTWQTHKESSYE
ncbi:CRISPR-associated protein Csx19 [Thermoleptolyngbya sp. C42_A2020_037]|uniref:type III-D CRISPR-associated protein Csx19 n=1 Tax=Thermoleptolyngbya sp. C42_A2020_037 TaxID=2747799 RepID=UPI0019F316C5|nr:CRISPR-associated protein Csx19 [Thermoleptolyngbya sp. C42_A2020_037]MBF2087002.1 TIGR03984 family CRISPR-associated protein [Thermoleptolyngbya sp. C42_A2020_037]